MPRSLKIIKNDKNEEIVVYVDNCTECSAEMIYPKEETDNIERLLPFIAEKLKLSNPCNKCLEKKQQEDKNYSFLTESEKQLIIETIRKQK